MGFGRVKKLVTTILSWDSVDWTFFVVMTVSSIFMLVVIGLALSTIPETNRIRTEQRAFCDQYKEQTVAKLPVRCYRYFGIEGQ